MTLALAASASAQTGSTGTSTGQNTSGPEHSPPGRTTRRPATTTFFGDTGLWFVPTAEVLAHGKWSVSALTAAGRTTSRATPTSPTSPARLPTALVIGPRSSARFCSIRVSIVTPVRCSSTIRPSAASSIDIRRSTSTGPATTSATSTSAPRSTSGRSADRNRSPSPSAAWSRCRRVRQSVGVSTGKADVFGDFIVSKEAAKVVDVSGYAGYQYSGP